VAHPAKLFADRQTGARPIPSAYDIAGSAHWYNKADNILCVWRDTAAAMINSPEARISKIYVQKVRWRHIGRIGVAELEFDTNTGRYLDMRGHSTRDMAGAA
jgi:twinkle protein